MYKEVGKKIIASIEARMGSSRLPGKVLMPLAGEPALKRLVDRLKQSQYLDGIVIATTEKNSLEIEMLAKNLGVNCFKGSEDDVLARVLGAVRSVGGDIIVEITGDCPLVDPKLVDKGIEEYFESGADYAANIIERCYPDGYDVQVFSVETLSRVDRLTNNPIDRVHVSLYIYNNPQIFSLHHWGPKKGDPCFLPNLRVTLDEKGDYLLLSAIYDNLIKKNPYFGVVDVIKFIKNNKKLLEINKYVRTKRPEEG